MTDDPGASQRGVDRERRRVLPIPRPRPRGWAGGEGDMRARIVQLQQGAGWLSFRTSGEFLSLSPDDRAFLDALAALLDKYERKCAVAPEVGPEGTR